MYLSKGKPNDKRLAASAIGKLALRYKKVAQGYTFNRKLKS